MTDAEYLEHIKNTYKDICSYTSGNAKQYIGFLLSVLESNKGFCYVGWASAAFDVIREELWAWMKSLIQRKR